jgi:hypothetical protein
MLTETQATAVATYLVMNGPVPPPDTSITGVRPLGRWRATR